MRQNNRQLTPLGAVIFFTALLNFAVFMIVAHNIGGDAWSGKVEGGHHFVSNHGRLTEVSARVWTYSWWHAVSIFITHPVGIAAAALLTRPRHSGCRITKRCSGPGQPDAPWELLGGRGRPGR